MRESDIIDFAQWYSGMERPKVEAAYQRYLRERGAALAEVQKTCIVSGCKNMSNSKNGKCFDHFSDEMTQHFNNHCL